MHAFAGHEDRPRRAQLNARQQRSQPADQHQPDACFTVRPGRAHAYPEQRDEEVVVSGLHIAIQKDRRPDCCWYDHPRAPTHHCLFETSAEQRQDTDRIQVEEVVGERHDIAREGEGKAADQRPGR